MEVCESKLQPFEKNHKCYETELNFTKFQVIEGSKLSYEIGLSDIPSVLHLFMNDGGMIENCNLLFCNFSMQVDQPFASIKMEMEMEISRLQ